MLNVVEPSGSPDVDEFTCEWLCIRVARKLKAADVIDVLADLFITRGTPGSIRSDNGPEFAAMQARQHGPAALLARLASARAGGDADNAAHAARHPRAKKISSTQASYALTFRLEHLLGVGHGDLKRLSASAPPLSPTLLKT